MSPIYKKGRLAGTRAVPEADSLEKNVAADDRLSRVVCVRNLMTSLIKEAKAKCQPLFLDPAVVSERDWLLINHPLKTSNKLPNKIRSEKDAEAWIFDVILRPLLAACCAAQSGEFSDMKPGSPNFTSCPPEKKSDWPDGILYDENDPKMSIEAKTRAALVGAGREKLPTFESLIGSLSEEPEYSVRFNWPANKKVPTQKADHMIMQIWTQMVTNELDKCAIINYDCVYFFFRKGKTLYMSPEAGLTPKNTLSIAIFAFIAYSLDFLHAKPHLPDVVDWWTQKQRSSDPGIDHGTLLKEKALFLSSLTATGRPARKATKK
ncbi:hypothetical protein FB45DRAFT_417014 [Roridomyces roridus]|uniref:Uncharacterized protein n=1 Tax=Roridomyces roridus TaxID=1738132 RepID=A0AAD7FV48_9AGAR|nr:hypothetical protein FB45DRAFT_417014 [Roridomyces roridus]